MYSYLQLDGFIKENNQRHWQRNKTSKHFRPKKVVVIIKYIYRIFFFKGSEFRNGFYGNWKVVHWECYNIKELANVKPVSDAWKSALPIAVLRSLNKVKIHRVNKCDADPDMKRYIYK